MAALPYIQLYTADYLADTAHLSTLEHGAYLLLIFNYWQRGESFKAKDERSLNKRLASVARLSESEWESVKENLEEYFLTSETEWKHERIERDLFHVNLKASKASAAGKASAASRANKEKDSDKQQFNGRSTDVQQTLNHTDTDTDTDINNCVLTNTIKKTKKNKTTPTKNHETAALIALGIDLDLAQDFLKIRKTKLTQTAINAIVREANKAEISPSDAVRICIERSWQSFNAGWNWNPQEKNRGDPTRSNLGLSENNGVIYDTKNRNNELRSGSGRKLSLVDEAQLAIDRIEERERRAKQEQAKVVN